MGTAKRNGDALEIDVRIIGSRGQAQGQQIFGQHYGGCAIKNCALLRALHLGRLPQKQRGVDGVARTQLAFASDRDSTTITGRRPKHARARKST